MAIYYVTHGEDSPLLWLPRQFFSTRSHITFGSSDQGVNTSPEFSGVLSTETHGVTWNIKQLQTTNQLQEKKRNLRTLFFK
jgi:hypothetical protein